MWLAGLLIIGFSMASLILPWLLRARINDIEARLFNLERNAPLSALTGTENPNPFVRNEKLAPEAVAEEETRISPMEPPPMPPDFAVARETSPTPSLAAYREQEKTEAAEGDTSSGLFELFAATKLPVWIGAIAIVFAVIYLVRYTIELGLLTPEVRLSIGFGFGVALLGAAQFIEYFATLNQSRRIAQGLTAAGLGGCYASVYAAYALYGFIPAGMAFVVLAGIAALGVFLSLRQGLPIALLGSLFGFLTPGLISTDHPNFYLLFGYLYTLFLSVGILARRHNWLTLAGLGIVMAYGWAVVWLAFSFTADMSWVASLFLIAVTFTILALFRDLPEASDPASPSWLLHTGGTCIGILLAAAIMPLGQYVPADAMLYGVLTAALAFLTLRDERQYRPLFFLAAALCGMLLLCWRPLGHELAYATLGVTFAFAAYHFLFVLRRVDPAPWAIFGVTALLAGFLLLWDRFDSMYIDLIGIPHAWGLLAVGYALVCAGFAVFVSIRKIEPPQLLAAIYAAGAAALVALAFMLELDRHWLPLAFSVEAFALYFIFKRARLENYYAVPTAVAIAALCALIPFIELFGNLLFDTLGGTYSIHIDAIDMRRLPLQLGVPAWALLSALIFVGRESHKTSKLLVYGGAFLTAYAVYFGIRLTGLLDTAGGITLLTEPHFVMRSGITLAFFALAFAAMFLFTQTDRDEWRAAGHAIFALAVARTLYFDVLIGNPLFVSIDVGSVPFFNGLALAYLAPAALLLLAAPRRLLPKFLETSAPAIALGLLFVYVNLAVRQIFHGPDLTVGAVPNAEIYTYSLAWLIFGIGVLAGGIYREDQKLRYVSLAVLLLTVSKVFLYDASELSGLYRVGSFLGLGLSLIGISYFYSRLVFKKNS